MRQLLSAYGKGKTDALLRRAMRAEHPRGNAILDELHRLDLDLSNPRELKTTDRRYAVLQARRDELCKERDAILAAIYDKYASPWLRAQKKNPAG
jgi:hypothetical protein